MVAAGPRLPKPIGGDNGGDEPLRISLGEGMMGEMRPRVQLCLLNCKIWWGRALQAWTAPGSRGGKQHGRCCWRRQPEAAPRRLARDICGRLPRARHSARRQPLRQPDVREARFGASVWCNVELKQRRRRRLQRLSSACGTGGRYCQARRWPAQLSDSSRHTLWRMHSAGQIDKAAVTAAGGGGSLCPPRQPSRMCWPVHGQSTAGRTFAASALRRAAFWSTPLFHTHA